MPRPSDPDQMHWRPAWAVWRQLFLGWLPCGSAAIALLVASGCASWFWCTLLCALLLQLATPLVLAYREWKDRPPTPRFWEIDGQVRLCIRSLVTRDVLLTSPKKHLLGQDLRDVWLPHANLEGVILSRADLRGATLRGACLRRAGLQEADLSEADLRGADLSCAQIRAASFRAADLCGANFRGLSLELNLWDPELGGADFSGARYSRSTRWPAGFDPRARGCILCEETEGALPIPAHRHHDLEPSDTLPRPAAAGPAEGKEVLTNRHARS